MGSMRIIWFVIVVPQPSTRLSLPKEMATVGLVIVRSPITLGLAYVFGPLPVAVPVFVAVPLQTSPIRVTGQYKSRTPAVLRSVSTAPMIWATLWYRPFDLVQGASVLQ